MCTCPHGFTGLDCEVKFDDCALKNCSVCVNCTCQCPIGELGRRVNIGGGFSFN